MSTTAPAPPPRTRGAGTVPDMLRSLLVCAGLVAVVVLLFFHPSTPTQRTVDVAGPTADARAAGLPVAAPRPGTGWEPTSARFAPDTVEGLPTWHVGYVTPSGRDAAVDVTRGATPAWIDGTLAGGDARVEAGGQRTIDGTAWTVRVAEVDGTTLHGLVRTEQTADGAVTTVVSGHASTADLTRLARASASAAG